MFVKLIAVLSLFVGLYNATPHIVRHYNLWSGWRIKKRTRSLKERLSFYEKLLSSEKKFQGWFFINFFLIAIFASIAAIFTLIPDSGGGLLVKKVVWLVSAAGVYSISLAGLRVYFDLSRSDKSLSQIKDQISQLESKLGKVR